MRSALARLLGTPGRGPAAALLCAAGILFATTPAVAGTYGFSIQSYEFGLSVAGMPAIQFGSASASGATYYDFGSEALTKSIRLWSLTGSGTLPLPSVAAPFTDVRVLLDATSRLMVPGTLGPPLGLEVKIRGYSGITLLSVPVPGQGTGVGSGYGFVATTQAGVWTEGTATVTTPAGGAVIQSAGSRAPDPVFDYTTTPSGGQGTFLDHTGGYVTLVKPLVIETNHSTLGMGGWAGFARLRIDGIYFYIAPEPGALALLAPAAVALLVARRKRAASAAR